VSPLIEQGTVCNTVFDHTSIIRTVANRWLQGTHLNERDLHATDLSEVLTLPTPRTDHPEFIMDTVPPFTGCRESLLSDLQKQMLAGAKHHVEEKTGEPVDISHVHTTEQAVALCDGLESKVRRL
jgi:hypothetical protein